MTMRIGSISSGSTPAPKTEPENSRSDLVDDMTKLGTTKRAVQAQTKVIKAQDEMLGTIIDLKA